MSDTRTSLKTVHGAVDYVQFSELQQTYDTGALLRAVDEIDQLVLTMTEDGGIRESLLRLHGMLNTVLNGARLTVIADDETLPELANDLMSELQGAMTTFRQVIKLVEPITKLATDHGYSP